MFIHPLVTLEDLLFCIIIFSKLKCACSICICPFEQLCVPHTSSSWWVDLIEWGVFCIICVSLFLILLWPACYKYIESSYVPVCYFHGGSHYGSSIALGKVEHPFLHWLPSIILHINSVSRLIRLSYCSFQYSFQRKQKNNNIYLKWN